MSAYEVALALATEHRPELVVDDQIDLDRAAEVRAACSSGEQVMVDLVLSLCGRGSVSLHLLDTLDERNRDIVAEAVRYL